MEKFFEKYIDTIGIVIGILCFVAFILWGVFGSDKESKPSYEELEEEVAMLQDEIHWLECDLEDSKDLVDFLEDENIFYQRQLAEYEESLALIIDGSIDYHKCIDYCDIVKNSLLKKDAPVSYKIYYFQTADELGYERCPRCDYIED